MILLIRAIKSNSFWILSAEENFVIKEESVQFNKQVGCKGIKISQTCYPGVVTLSLPFLGRKKDMNCKLVLLQIQNTKTCPLQYTENFFSEAKNENFIGKILIFLILLLKTLILGTR